MKKIYIKPISEKILLCSENVLQRTSKFSIGDEVKPDQYGDNIEYGGDEDGNWSGWEI